MKKKWTYKKIKDLFQTPFFDLMFKAQNVHRKNFNPHFLQISSLFSIKTGLCAEDCKYCAQSAKYNTKLKSKKLIDIDIVLKAAKIAKQEGVSRFCIGAAWRNIKDKDLLYLQKLIKEIKSLGMETCMTLGFLNEKQAKVLADAGLNFYNHNLDTSPNFYKKIVTTRTYQDRINTINIVRKAGIKVCSGGILGLGENMKDRIDLLLELSSLSVPPESVPINMLVKIKGTPLNNDTVKKIDVFEFIRTVAVARIIMPTSYIRLAAGRNKMSEEMQAICFMAGANSIFYGNKLLTTLNSKKSKDLILFKKLNIKTIFSCFDKKTQEKYI
ncbi:biotin synthase BioB [Candidatus Tachikawaea gelatinosa]|uniref:Biotin synthase n=1 Tax=Candidatus Tachikawaea gelatinosa TaxID=1410383 RepID=A0A090BWH6_9ENTR|nr:biotin synthase BioB [Candidatus Tachikawaea gelatinosa]BAP58621.1 biotin synthase [Candidatus Tachikawaea gelatinosa]